MKLLFIRVIFLSLFISFQNFELFSQSLDSLHKNFITPPKSAQPYTWWHWIKGNISKTGITKDLEWMKEAGIAGFQLSDVNFGGGQSVENKIMFGSDEWYEALEFSAKEAERLDLEMGIFSSPGWSITGGPWVKPHQAMKKVVWSDTIISGGIKFDSKIPNPPTNYGPFQNLSFSKRKDLPNAIFYKDIAVFAKRVSKDESVLLNTELNITSSSDSLILLNLFDNNFNSTTNVSPEPNNDTAWIKFEYGENVSVSSFSISAVKGIPFGRLLVSNDGKDYTPIVELPGAQLYRQGWSRTFTFPKVNAKYFKLELFGKALNPAETIQQPKIESTDNYTLREIKFSNEAKINRWEEKAGFRHLFEYESVTKSTETNGKEKSKIEFLNLTDKLSKNGTLQWEVPEGNWRILRIGYSLTGAQNRPPVPSGAGLEVDKLSKKYTNQYIQQYLEPIKSQLKDFYGSRLSHVLLDSWEAGMQNWTDEMISEFKVRRGYDPTPYLPCLIGYVVGSEVISDKFLWDYRRTIADMFAENHYGTITNYLNNEGLKTYAEASGVSLEILEDALLCKKYVDVPMGEFWAKDLHPSEMYYQDIRGAASASNIYGKNITAAEAFTGGGYESPFTLKKIADYWFCQGVNQIVFHTSAHQPKDTQPGNTMVGTHINRNITWAKDVKPFMDYLSRISYLLQQGNHVADVAYLLNEGAPSTMPIWGDGLSPILPAGYDYDYLNTDVLLNDLSVNENGYLTLSNGMEFKILILTNTNKMTLPVIKKIDQLVKDGAIIAGEKPISSPSLVGYPTTDDQVRKYASKIWGDINGISRNSRSFGKGKVIWGFSLDKIFKDLEILKDVEYSKPLDTELHWIHKRTNNAEIYFIVNNSETQNMIDVRFRVTGKFPEIWKPDSGIRESINFIDNGTRTTISLDMDEAESAFIVFSNSEPIDDRLTDKINSKPNIKLDDNWDLSFPYNKEISEIYSLDSLRYWSNFSDQKIKYFSGTAVYSNSFNFENKENSNGENVYLSLGEINDIANVILNGKELGVLWKPPYNIDVTKYLKDGINEIEIEVTNQWTNRIIGDLSLDEKDKILTYEKGAVYFFGPPPELPNSGLVGPVQIVINYKTVDR